METKICRICGEEKPIAHFPVNSQYNDGYDTRCRSCKNNEAREGYHKRKGKPKGGGNAELGKNTPRELIEELKARGYKGHLEYTKTIIL
jgi:hypothetical protein